MKDKYAGKLLYLYVLIDLIKLCINFSYEKEKCTRIQNKNVYRMMKHCYTIPFYRRKFEKIHLTPEDFRTAEDLYKFPITTKEELRDWFAEEITANPDRKKYWMRDSTSGSTGNPMEVYYAPKDRAMNIAIWMHAAIYNGFHPITGVTASISNPATVSEKPVKVRKIGVMRKYAMAYTKPAKDMVEFYNTCRPGFFYANRSKYIQMALYAQKNHIQMHQASLCASAAEKMDAASLELIKSVFGDVLYDTYGCTETGMLAFQKAGQNDRYLIRHDTHVVHVIDEEGRPAQKGRAILTSLYHYGFPVINYDVGDGIELFVDPKDGMTYIKEINGRLNDWIIFSDGTRINFQEVETVMKYKSFLQQYRFIQEDYDRITILLVKREKCSIDKEKEEAKIQSELDDMLGRKLKYSFQWKDEILPDANGKLRIIISRVKQ